VISDADERFFYVVAKLRQLLDCKAYVAAIYLFHILRRAWNWKLFRQEVNREDCRLVW
jgi:hypothetical protein